MNQVLKGIAILHAAVGFIAGFWQFVNGEQWNGIVWFVSGLIGAALFLALAVILEYLEDLSSRIRAVEWEMFKDAPPPAPVKLGNSKANLEKLKDFKL